MYSSINEKYEFISKELHPSNNNSDLSSNYLKIPMLIRNNGLFNTLMYMRLKADKSDEYKGLCYLCIEYYNQFLDNKRVDTMQVFINRIIEIKKNKGKLYMILTKEYYQLFSIMSRLVKASDKNLIFNDKYFKTIQGFNNVTYKNKIHNNYLKLNKYIRYNYKDKKHEIKTEDSHINISPKVYKSVLNHLTNNTKLSHVKPLFNKNRLRYKVENKLVIGFGEPSVREVNMKLDHIYGIPYIPASTIKGGFRNYITKEYPLEIEENERKRLIDTYLGTEDKSGLIVFRDIFINDLGGISEDIMTPHYSGYYSKNNRLPCDDEDPNPKKFNVIKGSSFVFNIYIKKRCSNDSGNEEDLKRNLEIIKKAFISFLDNCNMGAKKSVGYGYFRKC